MSNWIKLDSGQRVNLALYASIEGRVLRSIPWSGDIRLTEDDLRRIDEKLELNVTGEPLPTHTEHWFTGNGRSVTCNCGFVAETAEQISAHMHGVSRR